MLFLIHIKNTNLKLQKLKLKESVQMEKVQHNLKCIVKIKTKKTVTNMWEPISIYMRRNRTSFILTNVIKTWKCFLNKGEKMTIYNPIILK